MIAIQSLEDLTLLHESVSLECKLAAGRDGKGTLPEDFWPTYSAFANTDGGLVLLGLREKNGSFSLEGLENPDKLRTELFNNLNNRQKVSVNLLTDQHVRELEIEGVKLLAIEVPRAPRKLRPVYLTTNPLSGHTFRRLHEGDRPLPDEDVKRMLAEQVEDSRDDRILRGYSLSDLSMDTLRAYRQVFANRDPGHPWNAIDDQEFLRQLGGWRRDRETGEAGLTLAGLLMFGEMVAIQEELPNYMLDYQERPEAQAENRWLDRLTLDGKWSGNLYDFYRKVYLKLTADLKVPFYLEKGERQDETPVHVALREALANVLVHADYTDRASVLVVKCPDMFGFRNPGLMRIPLEVALQGSEADCRNRILHKMFRMVGVGEQAGTGIPKIFQGWKSQHWNPPKLYESSQPYNQTLMELRMIDLFPEQVIQRLRSEFGAQFDALSFDERVALAVAASEGTVNHARLCTVSSSHTVDLTRTLQRLTQLGFLASKGSGRGAVYFLPGQNLPTPDEVFGPPVQMAAVSSSLLPPSSLLLPPSSLLLAPSSLPLGANGSMSNPERDLDGYLRSDQLALPVISVLDALSPAMRDRLEALAAEPRQKRKLDRASMEATVLAVCNGHYLTLSALAQLVNRKPVSLRNKYLSSMVKSKLLTLAFPTTPTHERQAYCATSSLSDEDI